ncbi:MAG: methylated-DNA--[protein]-cysteine S-methyltransferase [Cytophagales bacterium]|nr:methylated-DNA--[protein]-cysteine S-methyltransferase [Cytophagales bacterium]
MLVTDPNRITTYYDALVEKRSDYVGIFYAGVKTTSVFCIATCRARKPKKENVEFYTSFKDALDQGYRPCKICRPTENANTAPDFVETAISMVRDHPKEKITDYRLREQGISPEAVRRWFKSQYGITFQTYQRMYRINNAYMELKQGDRATHAAFGNGYESLSGFGYTYKKLTGSSPTNTREQPLILISRTETPLGPMFIAATDKGICLLEFVDRRMLETELKDLQRLLKAQIITGENQHIVQAKKELGEYFSSERIAFEVSLDTPGTDFQQQVWDQLLTIPYGNTRSYQEQAVHVGNPKAVRAVASANGHNRVSIMVPCHRVIGKGGQLTGYGGGLERKRWLLDHESARS